VLLLTYKRDKAIEKVIGVWSKLHNEEVHNSNSSPDIIRAIRSRRMRCAGHIARMGEMINSYKTLFDKPKGK
jgi:hypothetical protein